VYTKSDMMVKKKRKEHPFWFEPPFEDFRKVKEEMRDMWSPWFRMPEIRFSQTSRFIRVRMGETDEEIILRAELPGFSKDEIELRVTSQTINIWAEKKRKSVEKEEDFFRAKQSYASANRLLTLPVEVKTEKIKAKLKDGVLEIVLPKKDIKKREEKEIKID